MDIDSPIMDGTLSSILYSNFKEFFCVKVTFNQTFFGHPYRVYGFSGKTSYRTMLLLAFHAYIALRLGLKTFDSE